MISNFCNKKYTCLLQDVFPWNPTKKSSKNIDFAIDTPPQCHTINLLSKFPLNCTNCNEGNDLLKTNLDEQLMSTSKLSKHKNY